MPQPVITSLGQQLYEALAPLTYADEKNNWALLRYVDAFMHAGQQAETYARSGAGGMTVLLDVNNCPSEALDWLGQFVGIPPGTVTRGIRVLSENLVPNPNFNRDALAAPPAGWAAAEIVKWEMSEGWATHKAGYVETKVMANAVSATLTTAGNIKLAGVSGYTLVKAGEEYTAKLQLNLTAITNTMSFKLQIRWFNINGELLSTSESAAVTTTGITEMSLIAAAPAGAVGCTVRLKMESTSANSKATAYIDDVMLLPKGNTPGDGDTAGWSWVGTAGNSTSRQVVPQTDVEWALSKREAIKKQSASSRGRSSTLMSIAKSFLLGNKTVFLRERDGGPAKLTVVTYEAETPNPAALKAAMELAVPGGIVLTCMTVPGATYIIIRAAYLSYKVVKETFTTYKGLKNNIPGT